MIYKKILKMVPIVNTTDNKHQNAKNTAKNKAIYTE